jgi:stage III sporulation protein AD
METFFKAAALALVCVILYLVLNKQNKDIALLLAIAACTAIAMAALKYLEPVFDFFSQLRVLGDLDPTLLQILLKATGIGILADFCVMICSDAGNASLGKAIQLMSAAIILWLSLPLFMNLIELINKLLGGL